MTFAMKKSVCKAVGELLRSCLASTANSACRTSFTNLLNVARKSLSRQLASQAHARRTTCALILAEWFSDCTSNLSGHRSSHLKFDKLSEDSVAMVKDYVGCRNGLSTALLQTMGISGASCVTGFLFLLRLCHCIASNTFEKHLA